MNDPKQQNEAAQSSGSVMKHVGEMVWLITRSLIVKAVTEAAWVPLKPHAMHLILLALCAILSWLQVRDATAFCPKEAAALCGVQELKG